MPAGEENDPKGVPFLVAPVQADDPKRKDADKPKSKEDANVEKAKAELKAETDELVSQPSSSSARRASKLTSRLAQSEEDAALKGELEMLVERLKVRLMLLLGRYKPPLSRSLALTGIRHDAVPTSAGVSSHPHPHLNFLPHKCS